MLIKFLKFFLNKHDNIITKTCYNMSKMDSLVVLYIINILIVFANNCNPPNIVENIEIFIRAILIKYFK